MKYIKKSFYKVVSLILVFSSASFLLAVKLTQETGPEQLTKWRQAEDYEKLDFALRTYLVDDGKSWALKWTQEAVCKYLDPCVFFHWFRNLINKSKKSSVGSEEVLEILTYKILICMRAIADIKICKRDGLLCLNMTDRYDLIMKNFFHRFKARKDNFCISFSKAFTCAKKILKTIDFAHLSSPGWVYSLCNDSLASTWMSFLTPPKKILKLFDKDLSLALRKDAAVKIIKKFEMAKTWEDFYSIHENQIMAPSLLNQHKKILKEKEASKKQVELLTLQMTKLKLEKSKENQKNETKRVISNFLIKHLCQTKDLKIKDLSIILDRCRSMHNRKVKKLDSKVADKALELTKTKKDVERLGLQIKELEKDFKKRFDQQKNETKKYYNKKLKKLGEMFSKDKKLLQMNTVKLEKEIELAFESHRNELESKNIVIKDLRMALDKVKKKK